MNPRGVTLVELLAAISILVVVTALALPALQNRMSAARLEAAQGQLQAAALATRADAMRQGKSLSLTAHASPSGEVELVVAPLAAAEATLENEPKSSSGSADIAERAGSTGSKWLTLPASIKINAEPPASAEQGDRKSSDAVSRTTDARERRSDSRDVRLALFCPDGSAVTSPVYLTDGDSVLIVTVNPWIGGVKFSNLVAEGRESATAEQSDLKSAEGGDLVARPNSPTIKVPTSTPASSSSPPQPKGAAR